jgi:hypothetical protein
MSKFQKVIDLKFTYQINKCIIIFILQSIMLLLEFDRYKLESKSYYLKDFL